MNPRIAKLLAGGAAAVVLTGAVGVTAFAQSRPTPTIGKPAAQARADAFVNALASKLGKTPDDVRNAAKSAEHDLVSQALQAGKINQDQANRLNQRIDRSNGLPFGRGLVAAEKAKGSAPAALDRQVGGKALAQFFGEQPKDVMAELRSGKSLAQIATAHGKTVDQLKSFIHDQAKTRLDAQVAAGKMTQAREDAALKRLDANLERLVNRVPKVRAKATPTSQNNQNQAPKPAA